MVLRLVAIDLPQLRRHIIRHLPAETLQQRLSLSPSSYGCAAAALSLHLPSQFDQYSIRLLVCTVLSPCAHSTAQVLYPWMYRTDVSLHPIDQLQQRSDLHFVHGMFIIEPLLPVVDGGRVCSWAVLQLLDWRTRSVWSSEGRSGRAMLQPAAVCPPMCPALLSHNA